MVSFWNTITGNDMSADLKAESARIAILPKSYQDAFATMQATLMGGMHVSANFTGRDLMPVFAGLTDYLEEAAADGLSIQAALGTDAATFATQAASANGVPLLLDKMGAQLNRQVHQKLGR